MTRTITRLAAVVVTLALLCCMAACGTQQGGAGTEDGRTESISLNVTTEEKTHNADDGILLLMTKYARITVTGGAAGVADAIMKAYHDEYEAGEEEINEQYKSAAIEAREYVDLEFYNGSYIERGVVAQRNDGKVFSMVVNGSDYIASASHGLYWSKGMNFDAATGVMLDITTMGVDGSDPTAKLVELCMAELGKHNEFNVEDLFEPEKQLPAIIAQYDQWYMTDTALVVVANPYDIAAYALGAVEMILPYDQLSGVIDAKWLPEAAAIDE